jgi:hypothetical protein
MSKYTWAWSDEDATYILEADSLFEIVETIVDYYYFGWGDDDDEKPYTITERDGKFLISINVDEESANYEIDTCSCDVIIFLETIARLEHRPDTFAIRVDSK